MSPVHRYGIAALALSVGFAVVPGARAANPPAPSSDSAALTVYVESVPTTQGPKPFWGLPAARRPALPRAARRRIEARGGADAGTLRRIRATAPAVTRVEGAAPAARTGVGAAGDNGGGVGGTPTTWRSSVHAAAGPALRRHRTALAAVALATLALLMAAARRRRDESTKASGDAGEEGGQVVAAE